MIVTVSPATVQPATPCATPAGASLLDFDFASLLAPAGEGETNGEARQDSAGDGKDLPDAAAPGDAWLALLGATAISLPPAASGTPSALAAPLTTTRGATTPIVAPVIAPASPQPGPMPPVAPTSPPHVLMPVAPTSAQRVLVPPVALTPPSSTALVSDQFAGAASVPAGNPFATHARAPAQPGMIAPLPAPAIAEAAAVSPVDSSGPPLAPAATIATTRDATPPAPVALAALASTAPPAAVIAERPAMLLQGLTAATRTVTLAPARPADRERADTTRLDGSIQLPLVAAAIASHKTMFDLRQEHWPQRMVEHIETLRDAADANDTRIRLVPDALGTVDVQLRREGETVHVAFAAERAETRALLDQAQPKLAELGEARGLRFAQSGADAQGQSPQRHAPAGRLPSAPPRTTTVEDAADETDTTRLA